MIELYLNYIQEEKPMRRRLTPTQTNWELSIDLKKYGKGISKYYDEKIKYFTLQMRLRKDYVKRGMGEAESNTFLNDYIKKRKLLRSYEKNPETASTMYKKVFGDVGVSSAKIITPTKIKSNKSLKILAVTALVTFLIGTSFKIYKRYYTETGKKCGPIKNPEDRKKCYELVKKNSIKIRIQLLKDNIQKCNSSEDPNQCKQKLISKIKKLEGKI